MSVTEQGLLAALSSVLDPHTGKDFVSTRALRNLQITGGDVAFDVELGYPAKSLVPELHRQLVPAAKGVAGGVDVLVHIPTHGNTHSMPRGGQHLTTGTNIIAVASGKGGVGKSTTAANLALALAAEGASVGVLDADIYGPSQPMMLGINRRPESDDGKTMEPLENYGVQVMSIGFLVDQDEAMIWRGPMATQALEQLLRQTNWKDLDYLIIDMPPGTGDIQLTLVQKLKIDGVVIVSTPQEIALVDARRAATMFDKTGAPILGVVENMAWFADSSGAKVPIFGSGGARAEAGRLGVPLLAEIPIELALREACDAGRPLVATVEDGPAVRAFLDLAKAVG